jgi:hypothetical protein
MPTPTIPRLSTAAIRERQEHCKHPTKTWNVYTGRVNTPSRPTIPAHAPIISLSKFCQEAGITPVTAWRWRKAGWLSTVNISGRQYLTGEAIATFLRRAEAGEFAKEHKTPNRRAAG